MNFKTCFLVYLFLAFGNIFGITKEFLQEITSKLKNQDGNPVSSPLTITTIKSPEPYVFSMKRIVFIQTYRRKIKIFNMLGDCLKTIHVGDMINSSDAMQEYVVVGFGQGEIQLFNLISGKNVKWKAYEAYDIFSSISLPVFVKMGKVDGKMCVISGSWDASHGVWKKEVSPGVYENYDKDGKLKIWDINESNDGTITVNCKKEISCSLHVFKIGVLSTINGELDIYCQLTGCEIAMFDWDKGKKYSTKTDYSKIVTLIEHDSFIVTAGGSSYYPEITIFDCKKEAKDKIAMEYLFKEKKDGVWGEIQSIISIPKTDYLCIFFRCGTVVFFDWKKKKIIEKFSTGQEDVKAGALLSFEGKLYTVVGLEDGNVKVALVGLENGTVKLSEVMSGIDGDFVGNGDR